jgi:hypothetical protein
MKKLLALFLTLYAYNAFADPAIDSMMADPTAMSNALEQGIAVVNSAQSKKSTFNSEDKSGQPTDPTRMNQNFRDALERVRQLKSATQEGANGALSKISSEDSSMPKITLLANVHRKNQEKSRATLRVNDKSEIVSAGDTITYFQGGEVMKIEVLEITKNYVKVTLMPINQTLILR